MRKILGIILIAYSLPTWSASVTGKISSLKIHTSGHSTAEVAQHTTFQMSSSLNSPCNTLYVGPDDNIAVSFLLASKAQQTDVKVLYNTNAVAPWDSQTCRVYAVDIL